ncbi:MAG: HAD family hydrolase [Candidatus Rokubacteria bacterium]|nr:HAD family hydrolase [Candidatus Rokubacteria bacterium]
MARPASGRPRAVLFDAGNTLLRMNYPAIADHLRTRGREVSIEAIEEAELRARVRLDAELARGASTEGRTAQDSYLAYLLEGIGIAAPDEVEAAADFRRSYNAPAGLFNIADPAALRAIQQVKSAGLVAGVVSNSNGWARALLAGAGLGDALDFVIDSAVVGVEKPDPRIFRLGLEQAGVAAHEAVYVGDLYSVDVLGSRAAGLGAILLDPRGFWGPRDCATARDLLEATGLILGTAGGTVGQEQA